MGTAIAAVDCQEAGLKKLVDEIKAGQGRCAMAVLDVTDAHGLKTGVGDLEKELGPIDLLIASAGLGLETSGLDYQVEVMNRVLNVNLLGVSNSIAAVVPGMLQRKRGHLVALSSMASFRGLPRMLAYSASKAGVNAMMEGLRIEVEPEGLFTTTVCPGWIRTPMTAPIAGMTPRMLEVDDAARRIIWAIQKKRRFYAFPAGMVWQMRILNLIPRFLRDRLFRTMMRRLEKEDAMKKTALAVLAHPDDAEFLCVGSLIRLQQEAGWEVHIATMTAGDCGSVEHGPDEIARIRRAEGEAAARHIHASYHCVGAHDLRIHFTEDLVLQVTELLCQVRPDLVFTHSPDDYMLDHEMTSMLVRAATFAAPIPNFLKGRSQQLPIAHIPHLYYCDPIGGTNIFGQPVRPEFWVDITRQIDTKAEALACHASQRNWLIKHHGLDDYLHAMRDWAKQQGGAAGVAYAEGFRQHLGHSYPSDNVLKTVLQGIDNRQL